VLISSQFFSGWRFEVPAQSANFEVFEVGYYGTHDASGSLFAALVELSDSNDRPTPQDLSGTDVIATGLLDSQAAIGGQDVVFPIAASLAPGWYAVVFGAGAHGASANGTGTFANDQSPNPGVQLVFTMVQSNDNFVNQSAQPRVFARGVVVPP
jgi:hypothetical protein